MTGRCADRTLTAGRWTKLVWCEGAWINSASCVNEWCTCPHQPLPLSLALLTSPHALFSPLYAVIYTLTRTHTPYGCMSGSCRTCCNDKSGECCRKRLMLTIACLPPCPSPTPPPPNRAWVYVGATCQCAELTCYSVRVSLSPVTDSELSALNQTKVPSAYSWRC